ncbi:MAG: hypothetical protein KY476_23685 [Planctomycetes bacterium]|nr:hypothetical protein [Planctomycetota bacterium]
MLRALRWGAGVVAAAATTAALAQEVQTWQPVERSVGRASVSLAQVEDQPVPPAPDAEGQPEAPRTEDQPAPDAATQPAQPPRPVPQPDQPPAQQQPTSQPPPQTPPPPRTTRSRVASRAPNMFGDFLGSSVQMQFNSFQLQVAANGTQRRFITTAAGSSDVPLGGGATRMNPSENNSAAPQQRLFFMHSYFHNALSGPQNDGLVVVTDNLAQQVTLLNTSQQSVSVDRYTFGFENLLGDGWMSIGARMPFTSRFEFEEDPIEARSGVRGNLNAFLKWMLYRSDATIFTVGVGLDAPTGSDSSGRLFNTRYRIQNEAFHVQPFVAILSTPDPWYFYHGFISGDFATSANPIDVDSPLAGGGTLGKLDNQDLLHVDLGGGVWLSRNPDARGITGVAGIVEVHYTTTLEDAEAIGGNLAMAAPGMAETLALNFGSAAGRRDILNMTAGFHVQIRENIAVRVAAVAPLRLADDALFDVEVQTSVNVFLR